ncbi:MAG: sugar phosphate isomerase/epimerase family protein [Thermoguttaceae bacterium]
MQRRDFLVAASLAGATSVLTSSLSRTVKADDSAAVTPAAGAASTPVDQRAKAKLRIGCNLAGWVPGNNDVEKLAQIKAWGMEAVEAGGGVVNNPKEFKKKADDAGLKVSDICFGALGGRTCSADPEEQKKAIDELKRALEAAAVLESCGVVYVPAFNGDQERIKRTHQEIRRCLIDIDPNTKDIKGGFLKEVGDFAAGMNVNVILEPLNRKEAWFLRQVGDAASICRDCQSDGVKTMGDFYHMYYEEPCAMAAFMAAGPYLTHVHFGSGNRRIMPSQDPSQSFLAGFRGLKFIGYDKFMCFECGCAGDAKTEVPKVLEFLKATWEEA